MFNVSFFSKIHSFQGRVQCWHKNEMLKTRFNLSVDNRRVLVHGILGKPLHLLYSRNRWASRWSTITSIQKAHGWIFIWYVIAAQKHSWLSPIVVVCCKSKIKQPGPGGTGFLKNHEKFSFNAVDELDVQSLFNGSIICPKV